MGRYTVEATITVDTEHVDSGSEAVLYVSERIPEFRAIVQIFSAATRTK